MVDDGSTDETPNLLASWSREDSRLVVIRQENNSQTLSLNRAIASATGRYLARQDADDISEPVRFARQLEHLNQNPHLAVVATGTIVINANAVEIARHCAPCGAENVKRELWRENVLTHGSVMMRRQALEAAGGYRPGFRYAKDWDLWLRMLQQGFAIDSIPDFLYRWRLSPSGAYTRERRQQVKFAGLALTFAKERERYGVDSHEELVEAREDLDGFAAGYRLRGPLYALWGELCLRSLSDRSAATRYLMQALANGYIRPRSLALLCLSLSGARWPGRAPLRSS